MRHNDPKYIVAFAAAVCVVCSLLVSSAATILKQRQAVNVQLDKQRKVLDVSGLVDDVASLDRAEVRELFKSRIRPKFVELSTGEVAPEGEFEAATYDAAKAMKDPETSKEVAPNPARVSRVPLVAMIYEVYTEDGNLDRMVFPVEGKGLWSTLYGFVALDTDFTTIHGLTFYSHGETPGLGGEVDNPSWKAKWPGRKVYDENWKPQIRVIKGPAPAPEAAPHKVDGLSGATLTSNGVTNLLRFWFGDDGFGPYVSRLRAEGSNA